MAYASGLCYGGLPVMVGWVASLVAIADSTTTELQKTLIRLFMPVCIVLCSVFFCVCTKHAKVSILKGCGKSGAAKAGFK